MEDSKIYFTMEHCTQLGIEYFKSYGFFLQVEKAVVLRSSWDALHTEMFEQIISDFGLGSELELERTQVNPETPCRVEVDPPGWYKIISVAGRKRSWRKGQ
tara:strand:- start:2873 stop:3175 length:303 start_codon:yes stop_codon:yes gene_type:complete